MVQACSDFFAALELGVGAIAAVCLAEKQYFTDSSGNGQYTEHVNDPCLI